MKEKFKMWELIYFKREQSIRDKFVLPLSQFRVSETALNCTIDLVLISQWCPWWWAWLPWRQPLMQQWHKHPRTTTAPKHAHIQSDLVHFESSSVPTPPSSWLLLASLNGSSQHMPSLSQCIVLFSSAWFLAISAASEWWSTGGRLL